MRVTRALPLLAVPWATLPAQGGANHGGVDTLPPGTVVEEAYAFSSDSLTLAGTLTLPTDVVERLPVVLVIAGSGPTDRNGNSRSGQLRSNTYAQLAWSLAERGIAALRYDKRVIFTTRGVVDYANLTLGDFVEDVVAAARSLREDGRFGDLILAGHSEGAWLAMEAATSGLEVEGIALLAGAGRSMTELLREQVSRQVPPNVLVTYDSAMARYLRGEPTGDVPPGLRALFAPVNRRFVQSLTLFSPTESIARLAVPVTIIQGETDIQVRVRDAIALHSARPDARLVLIPAANHLFKSAADTTLGAQLVTYTDPSRPLVPELVDAMVTFVRGLPDPSR